MTHIIMSGPIKPLTEVERAAAAARIGYVFRNGECWLSPNKCLAILNYGKRDGIWALAKEKGWRFLKLPEKGTPHGYRIYYAQKDVVSAAKSLKQRRKG